MVWNKNYGKGKNAARKGTPGSRPAANTSQPNNLGEVRRSAILSTFGPGSIVDLRANEAPVSVLVPGLEDWDRSVPPAGLANEQTLFEPRLQKRLGVAGFRLPPVDPDAERGAGPALPGVRFPVWLQCTVCHVLKPSSKWGKDAGKAYRFCSLCTTGTRKVFAIPVRFIVACEAGHVDDFPWNFWVGHLEGCLRDKPLVMKSKGAGLAGLLLQCPACGASRNMDGVFSQEALKGLKCQGRRPWLTGPSEEGCAKVPRVLQRGASNLYFPFTHSALDIPPWSDHIQKMLGQYWDPICRVPKEQRSMFIETLSTVIGDTGFNPEQLAGLISERLEILEGSASEDLRWDEYRQFVGGKETTASRNSEFEIRLSATPENLAGHLGGIVRAVRLREVRVISGFTRIRPPDPTDGGGGAILAPIQRGHLNWLPAIEVRGEGIFLALNQERLTAWESESAVRDRAEIIQRSYGVDWAARAGSDGPPPRKITARFLLLHTLAHALMRQLSLDCGYSTSSLRERLYAGESPTNMCGILIYTATSDSDGTLGGLVRQGNTLRMAELVPAALRAIRWCSSDPLCIERRPAYSGDCNLAACHACVLAPETSCEEFNRFLDRAMLLGTPDRPEIGFFSDLILA